MTLVNYKLMKPTDDGLVPAAGVTVEFKPTAWSINDAIVLPSPFSVVLDENGEAVVELLSVTGPEWAWRAREKAAFGNDYFFYVDESETALNFWELSFIDPETLEPALTQAAWASMRADIDGIQNNFIELTNNVGTLTGRVTTLENAPNTLNDLSDVDVEGATHGMVLSYYVDETPGGSSYWTASGVPYPAPVAYSPILEGMTVSSPAVNGWYIQMGNLVTFSIHVDFSKVTDFGTTTNQVKLLNGLPLTPLSGASNHFSAWINYNPASDPDLVGHYILNADHLNGTTTLDMHYVKAGAANQPVKEAMLTPVSPATITTSSVMYINGTYIAQ